MYLVIDAENIKMFIGYEILSELLLSAHKYIVELSSSKPVNENDLAKTKDMMYEIIKIKDPIEPFILCCDRFEHFFDTIKSIGLGGLYVLCKNYRERDDYVYTHDNLCDICKSLINVKPYVRNIDKCLNRIYIRNILYGENYEKSCFDYSSITYSINQCIYYLFTYSRDNGAIMKVTQL